MIRASSFFIKKVESEPEVKNNGLSSRKHPLNLYIYFKQATTLRERNDLNKMEITVSSSVNTFALQQFFNYVKYPEATQKR
ncbi:MAG: hypothetical protein KatS3mg031_0981 [Chitinophagales bacterium]|nr:MAG: hypothetical protein KatS3mg031_0981 [Chitinophagales bacterium]